MKTNNDNFRIDSHSKEKANRPDDAQGKATPADAGTGGSSVVRFVYFTDSYDIIKVPENNWMPGGDSKEGDTFWDELRDFGIEPCSDGLIIVDSSRQPDEIVSEIRKRLHI